MGKIADAGSPQLSFGLPTFQEPGGPPARLSREMPTPLTPTCNLKRYARTQVESRPSGQPSTVGQLVNNLGATESVACSTPPLLTADLGDGQYDARIGGYEAGRRTETPHGGVGACTCAHFPTLRRCRVVGT